MSGVPIHGEALTPEYRAWKEMKRRCYNKKCHAYPMYGGRGITVCDTWIDSVTNFITDMGRKPSSSHEIDRIDNDAGYTPDNCRWATRTQNSRNRRNNRLVTVGSREKIVAEWSEESGIAQSTIIKRLDAGWPERRAVFELARSKRANGNAKHKDRNDCIDCGDKTAGVRCRPCENRNRVQ